MVAEGVCAGEAVATATAEATLVAVGEGDVAVGCSCGAAVMMDSDSLVGVGPILGRLMLQAVAAHSDSPRSETSRRFLMSRTVLGLAKQRCVDLW